MLHFENFYICVKTNGFLKHKFLKFPVTKSHIAKLNFSKVLIEMIWKEISEIRGF